MLLKKVSVKRIKASLNEKEKKKNIEGAWKFANTVNARQAASPNCRTALLMPIFVFHFVSCYYRQLLITVKRERERERNITL